MASRRKLCDDDRESKLICDTNSDEDVEDAESDEDDYYSEEERINATSAATDYEVGAVV